MSLNLETFSYGDHNLQTVTVANLHPKTPFQNTDADADTDTDTGYWVILIHGGAWRDPTQTSTTYLTPTLKILSNTTTTTTGTTTTTHPLPIKALASISYRLSPHPSHPQDPSLTPAPSLRTAKHPDHLTDLQTALAFLQKKYSIGERYILVGHSCGATMAFQAVSVSVSQSQTQPQPTAILGMAGIYNLRLLRDSHKDISAYQEFIEGAFGSDEAVWDAVSPGTVEGVRGVERGWGRGRLVVLAHSDGDTLCDVEQSEEMRGALGGWVSGASATGQRQVHFFAIEGDHDEAWEAGDEVVRALRFTFAKLREMGVCS